MAAPPSGFSSSAKSGLLQAALARLDALVDWERRARGGPPAAAMRVDLSPCQDLCGRLGNPERSFKSIQVAGTKGKGSLASILSRALGAAGLSCGLYTSPHVQRITERICVDGKEIGEDELARALNHVLDARDQALEARTAAADATWFDVLTATAFWIFRDRKLAWAVVECGLGGRLDSTNVLQSELAIVTNIDLEHTEVLGDTRAAIASEKVGILNPGASLISGVPASDVEVHGVLSRRVAQLGAKMIGVEAVQGLSFEEESCALAKLALEELGRRGFESKTGLPLGASLLNQGLISASRLPGRMEIVPMGDVRVVLDGAHVPSSLERVLTGLESRKDFAGPLSAILGLGLDKDLPGLLKVLRGRVDRVFCTSVGSGPARTPGEILAAAHKLGVEAETASTPRMALANSLAHRRPSGWILATGSLHLVGAVRTALETDSPDTQC